MNISTLGSTFEISLRILLMLNELQGSSFDEQQIGAVDFISVYAADFGLLDENLHGYSNYRFSEYPARKYIVAELEKIKRHLSELGDAQRSVAHQQETIMTTIHALEEKRDAIDVLISNQLQPRLAAFEKELEQQLKLIQISSELEVIRQDEIQYRGDLFSKETEEISDSQKHSIFEDYGYDIIHGFEEKLRDILTASKVGGAATARLNMENFDIEIGGFKKSVSMGGGFCGILNTITTLAMSAYLIDLDRPAPGFYAVDSSLTQLSEAEHKAQSETIKQNFVEYLIAHARERQVIIVEQSKRMPFVPSESEKDGVHVIQFSRNRQEGRYGFLNEVYNPEDR